MTPASQTASAYDRMRSEILSLDLLPGARLTERGLEQRFGVSRTPARAALMRLEGEGLVQREGRGFIVAPIDLAEIRALAELREAVESAAVRHTVRRARDEDIAALGQLVGSARPTADGDAVVRAGGDFHVQLARLSENPFMVDAVQGAMTRLVRTRWLEVRTKKAREQAWREHRAIVAAVAERDGDGAAELVVAHARDTNGRLLDYLATERRRLRGRGLSIVADAGAAA